MGEFTAPALRGNDSLGFLAALGVLGLAEQGCIDPIRLRWEGGLVPLAVFESDTYAGAADLAKALREVVLELDQTAGAIPGLPIDFPYRQRRSEDHASGADPMRMSREAVRGTYLDAAKEWGQGKRWFGRWLIALLALGTVDGKDAVRLTPFNAPFGQMKFRDSYFDQARREIVRRAAEGLPGDALVSWTRVEDYTGANLDERAIRDAVISSRGKPNNAGAPSPTWLALMGVRFFPMADDGRLMTVAWQDLQLYSDATRRSLLWATWRQPLDASAVRTLVAHPDLRLLAGDRHFRPVNPLHLEGLGVTAIYGASRRTRTQGDGPLGPAVRLWPRPRARGDLNGAS